MIGVQNNPFHKPNPFRVVNYQKFQHPHMQSTKHHDHQHLIYKETNRPQPNRILENNWTFNQNNLNKKYDFSRKVELSNSRVSDFQMKMKMSNIGIPYKNNQKVPYVTQAKLQNPFFRKNLLINKEQVLNQVELDVSLYRTKAKSSYVPMISQDNSYQQKISQGNINPSPSLNYSPQTPPPTITQRLSKTKSDRPLENIDEQQQQNPKIINFNGRKFFLN